MTVERIIPEEHAITRTLEKINRETGMAAAGSKRRARLNAEKAAVENKLRRRREMMPDS